VCERLASDAPGSDKRSHINAQNPDSRRSALTYGEYRTFEIPLARTDWWRGGAWGLTLLREWYLAAPHIDIPQIGSQAHTRKLNVSSAWNVSMMLVSCAVILVIHEHMSDALPSLVS
jgi:hypothetical protein